MSDIAAELADHGAAASPTRRGHKERRNPLPRLLLLLLVPLLAVMRIPVPLFVMLPLLLLAVCYWKVAGGSAGIRRLPLAAAGSSFLPLSVSYYCHSFCDPPAAPRRWLEIRRGERRNDEEERKKKKEQKKKKKQKKMKLAQEMK